MEKYNKFTEKHKVVLLILLLLVFTLQGLFFIYNTCATCDEPAHIPAGWTYWKNMDFRMNPEHPPLIKFWCAIPLMFMNLKAEYNDSWDKSNEWTFGHDFIYKWNKDKPIIESARIMNLLLGILCAFVLFMFARKTAGTGIAFLALFFFVFNPDLIAHSCLVTTDLGLTLFYLITAYGLMLISRGERIKGAILLSAGISCANIVKHSAVMIIPMAIIYLFFFSISSGINKREEKRIDYTSIFKELGKCFIILSVCAVFLYLFIWIIYGMKYQSIQKGVQYLVNWEKYTMLDIRGDVINVLRKWRIFPDAYIYGWNDVLKKGDRPTFIWGNTYPKGVWFYFLSTFVMKTPLSMLTLLVLGTLISIIKLFNRFLKRKDEFDSLLPFAPEVWFPPLYYIVFFVLLVRLNLGNRHILPVYPFICIIAAVTLYNLCTRLSGKIFAALFAVAYILGVLYNAPNYLSYVNFIGGGSENGWRMLSDSNYDWGQDLKALKIWADKNGNPEIKLAYFGNDDPGYRGLNYILLPSFEPYYYHPEKTERELKNIYLSGYFAISTNHLNGLFLEELHIFFNPYEYFLDKQPIAKAGNSILIFYEDGNSSTTLLKANQEVFRKKIKDYPFIAKYYTMLAASLYDIGDKTGVLESISALNTSIYLEPDYYENYMILASIYMLIGKPEFAENTYLELLKRNDKHIFALNGLGYIYMKTNREDKAIKYFEKSLEIVPEYSPARQNLILSAIQLKDDALYEKHIKLYEIFEPGHPAISQMKGQYYYHHKDFKQAEYHIGKYLEFNSNDIVSLNYMGIILIEEGDYQKALEYLERATAIDPNNEIIKENYNQAKSGLNNKK